MMRPDFDYQVILSVAVPLLITIAFFLENRMLLHIYKIYHKHYENKFRENNSVAIHYQVISRTIESHCDEMANYCTNGRIGNV